jgi:hypothetical protein
MCVFNSERSRQSSINKAQDFQSDIEIKNHHDDHHNLGIWDPRDNLKLLEVKKL